MMTVRLWLTVYTNGDDWPSKGRHRLFWRDVEMAHLPDVGDDIVTVTTAVRSGEFFVGVRRRHWDFDGRTNLELRHLLPSPTEEWSMTNERRMQSPDFVERTPGWRMRQSLTLRDGELADPVKLIQHIIMSGWIDFSERRP